MENPPASATNESPPKNLVQRVPTSTAMKTHRFVLVGTRRRIDVAPNGISNVNPHKCLISTGSAPAKVAGNVKVTIKSAAGSGSATGAFSADTLNHPSMPMVYRRSPIR
ncbi:hypothetical protein Q9L58_004713 [Maublancomyces gigas]|uniref:Uncharacterized protein n=1 Tax=Discina gigas TaxID=1032678 RepID=A0ABR3GKB1_9PEZI